MTPKELLYIDDVLGNVQQIEKSCTDLAAQIQDSNLKTMLQDFSTKHRECFGKFINLING